MPVFAYSISRSGMRLVVDVLELLFDEVGVHLRGGYIGMTEHFLYRMDVRAVFEQVRGERVAQCVRRDVLLNARLLLVELDYLPEALTGHALTADIDKE